jgi:hypothetical protein
MLREIFAWRRDDGTYVTLILPPPAAPDPPSGHWVMKFRRRLQGFLEMGGGWRVWDVFFGMCQTRH